MIVRGLSRNIALRHGLLGATRRILPIASASTSRISMGYKASHSRQYSTPPDPEQAKQQQTETGLAKIRTLIRLYGRTAFLVYMALSVADLTAIYFAIQSLGIDKVRGIESAILGFLNLDRVQTNVAAPSSSPSAPTAPTDNSLFSRLMAELKKRGVSQTSLTILVLSYTIHKTLFLPLRVGLTAWIAPRLVRRR